MMYKCSAFYLFHTTLHDIFSKKTKQTLMVVTNTLTVMDLEGLIEHLKAQKITAIQIAKDLGVERGEFYSWRTSVKPERRAELEKALRALYADKIEEEKGQPEAEASKYLALLEKTLEECRDENRRLKEQNQQMWEKIFSKN